MQDGLVLGNKEFLWGLSEGSLWQPKLRSGLSVPQQQAITQHLGRYCTVASAYDNEVSLLNFFKKNIQFIWQE